MALACLATLGFALLVVGAGLLLWERRQRVVSLPYIAPDPNMGPPPVGNATNLISEGDARQLSFLEATLPNRRWLGRPLHRPPSLTQPPTPTHPQPRARTRQPRAVLALAGLSLAAFACALGVAFAPWGVGGAGIQGGVVVAVASFSLPGGALQPSAPLAEYIMQAATVRGYSNVIMRVASSPPVSEAAAEAEAIRLGADFLLWGEIGAGGDITANVTLRPDFSPGQRQWQLYTELDPGALILPQQAHIYLPASKGADPLVPLATALIALRLGDYVEAALYAGGASATLADGGDAGSFPRMVEAMSYAAAGEPGRAIEILDALDIEGRLPPEGAVNRAFAHLMLSDYAGAIADAERALGDREASNRATARAYLARARARYRVGRGYGGAISDLDEAARLDPLYPLYRLDKAETFYRQAQPDSARTELQSLTGHLWDAAPAHRLLGLVQLMLGRPDDAFAPLDKAAEMYNAWLAEMRGEEAAAQVAGDAGRARAATEGILQLNRELASVYLYQGVAWADKAKGEPEESFLGGVWRNIRGEPTTYERAIRRMEEATRLDPNRADISLHMGNVYIAMGDTGRGAKALEQALALDPTAPEAYIALARLQEAQGNPQEAIGSITQLIENAAYHYPAYEELYRLYRQLGDEGAARSALANSLSPAPRQPADHLWRGKFLRILGRNEEAIQELNAALADPDLWEAHIYLGELLQEAGRLPDALAEYRQALSQQPNDPRALLGAGRLLVLAGETGEAEKLFARLTSLAPGNVDGHIAYLQIRLQKGDLEGALESGKRAVEAGPSRLDARFYLGVAHEARREWGAAAESYKAALERDPNHFDALMGWARSLINAGRTAEALEAASRAVEIRGDDPQAHRWLAEARLATGDAAGALQSLSRALELSPNWPDALALASRAYLLGGDRDAALLYANQAVAGNPRDPAGYLAQGDALLAMGRHIEARAAFDGALGVSPPGNAGALVGKGRAQAGEGDHAGALVTYTGALQADEKSAEAYFYSARSYEAIVNLDEAHKRYAMAVELSPGWAEALIELGKTYLARGDGEQALGTFERATKVSPNMAPAWLGYGMALRRQGRLAEATEALRQATQLDANNADAWLNLGLSLEERGDRGGAYQAFTQARQRATGDSVRRQAESGLERVK